MDIFIINTLNLDNIDEEFLFKFKNKKITDKQKLREHCVSYLMLDKILNEVYKIENREIEFINKKPYLKNRQKFFSISHSGKYIAISFSDYECGIDIEEIKFRNYEAISKRMNFNCKSLEDFYLAWTKYEAEYKFGGKYTNIFQTKIENYMLTTVSSNPQETFEIYIQNGGHFSKS